MPFATIVIGPAGVGKTTLAHALQVHGEVKKRGISVMNMDPAADAVPYRADVDIRELITVEDAMTEMTFGPNGGLIYCMEYLLNHLEWLEAKLEEFAEDETLIIDCPGQLELYTHVPVMPRLVAALESWGIRLCVAYLMDAVAIHDPSKFIAGSLAGLAAMLQIPAPRITVLSKADLVPSPEALEDFMDLQSTVAFLERSEQIDRDIYKRTPNYSYSKLQRAIARVVDDHAMLSFVPFSIKDDDSPGHVLSFSDHLTQYDDHAEVRIHEDENRRFPEEDDPYTDFSGGGGYKDLSDEYLTDLRQDRSIEDAARAIFGPGSLGDGYS